MARAVKLVGGPGTGKTRDILNRMIDAATRFTDPRRIGFCSFTVAARAEAVRRASEAFNIPADELRASGNFGTIHSICHRALRIGNNLLTDKKADREWVEQSINEELSQELAGSGGDSLESQKAAGDVAAFSMRTPAAQAMGIWSAARNRLIPLRAAWDLAWEQNSKIPDYEFCEHVISKYEEAKATDGRVDFTDLLLRVAGKHHSISEVQEISSEGVLPLTPAWFHDEAQDMSALSMAVFKKLISGSSEVTLCADPFQNLYSFAGSDSRHFLDFPADETVIMPRSYRCPENILRIGETCIRHNREWFDRGIHSELPAAEVLRTTKDYRITNLISDPGEPWLVLCRTNFQANQIATRLTQNGIPWTTTEGGSAYGAPRRTQAVVSLYRLASGFSISGEEWASCLGFIPSRTKLDEGDSGSQELLTRGTKSRFESANITPRDQSLRVTTTTLRDAGGTELLSEFLETGRWKSLPDLKEVSSIIAAIDRHGESLVLNPQVRVGTIHSAKGMESDNVLLFTQLSKVVQSAMQTADGREAENRLWYVGVTRTQRRLVVADSQGMARKGDYAI